MIMVPCTHCKKEVERKRFKQNFFCSDKCESDHKELKKKERELIKYRTSAYSKLHVHLRSIQLGLIAYLEDDKTEEAAIASASSAEKNKFHAPMWPQEYTFHGAKRVKSFCIEDEMFGRTSITRKAVLLFKAGYSLEEVEAIVRLSMVKCLLPKLYKVKTKKGTVTDLNTLLKEDHQSDGDFVHEIWSKELFDSMTEKYDNFLIGHGYNPNLPWDDEAKKKCLASSIKLIKNEDDIRRYLKKNIKDLNSSEIKDFVLNRFNIDLNNL